MLVEHHNWWSSSARKQDYICNQCSVKKRAAAKARDPFHGEKRRKYEKSYRQKPLQKAKARFRRTRKRGPRGYVYVLSNPAWPAYVKIGRAVSVEKRIHMYQTGAPLRDYQLECAIEFQDCWAAEGLIHYHLWGFRVGGTEWFHLHAADARAALLKIQEQDY